MNLYLISIQGCDDSTQWVERLTEKEVQPMLQLAVKSRKYSQYGCQPTIAIYLVPESVERELAERFERKESWDVDENDIFEEWFVKRVSCRPDLINLVELVEF